MLREWLLFAPFSEVFPSCFCKHHVFRHTIDAISYSHTQYPIHVPYDLCMEYLPTFWWFLGPMLINIPYMEHMGVGLVIAIGPWLPGKANFRTGTCRCWRRPMANLPRPQTWPRNSRCGAEGNAIALGPVCPVLYRNYMKSHRKQHTNIHSSDLQKNKSQHDCSPCFEEHHPWNLDSDGPMGRWEGLHWTHRRAAEVAETGCGVTEKLARWKKYRVGQVRSHDNHCVSHQKRVFLVITCYNLSMVWMHYDYC